MLHAAAMHGTLCTAARHLRARSASQDADAAPFLDPMREAEAQVLASVGEGMRLRHWGERILRRFAEESVPAAIVKGPVAAARLYRHASDRMFTDIDIVLPPAAVAPASALLHALGFAPDDIPGRDAEEHREFKWVLASGPGVHVEVQTDMIHSARARSRSSVDFDAICAAGDGDPSDATALLFVAAVHASLGHQFERLELVIDVLQAVRGAAGAIDGDRLSRVAAKSGTTRAVAAALAFSATMYRDQECAALARRLMPGMIPMEWRCVSPLVTMMAQSVSGRRVAWRRKLFRRLANRSAPRRAQAAAAAT